MMAAAAVPHRCAIYFTPAEDTALARFGARWFGSREEGSAESTVDRPDSWVAAPRRYGFHATLKAPFRPAPDAALPEILAALEAFAADRPPIEGPPLALGGIARFLALVPAGDCPALRELADDCTERFDRFRAPLTDAERTRRAAAGLTRRQRTLLERWGYPYVLDEYRFHMTLTGPLGAAARERARAVLAPMVAPLGREPLRVDAVSLCVEEAPGRPFRPVARIPFAG